MARQMLRVLGGVARGRRLHAPPGLQVRPARARLRDSLGNMLQPCLAGARVLDLFAGTGSLGIELLSRGARWATFVEQEAVCAAAVRRNLQTTGFLDRAACIHADAFRWTPAAIRRGERFDLVLVDPPYALLDAESERERLLALCEKWLCLGGLRPGGRLLLEHRRGQLQEAQPIGGLSPARRRRYGQTNVFLYAPASGGTPREGGNGGQQSSNPK